MIGLSVYFMYILPEFKRKLEDENCKDIRSEDICWI